MTMVHSREALIPTETVGPVRVQLSRKKGWRMPENTVKVDRTTVFGNPYTIDDMGRHDSVEAFKSWAGGPLWEDPNMRADQIKLRARIEGLRGKNVACWCRLDQTCHGDVLLELANAPSAPPLGMERSEMKQSDQPTNREPG